MLASSEEPLVNASSGVIMGSGKYFLKAFAGELNRFFQSLGLPSTTICADTLVTKKFNARTVKKSFTPVEKRVRHLCVTRLHRLVNVSILFFLND
jgi:hypothetical protein